MKQSVINCTDFESKSPLRSDLNYPEGATLNLDEKGGIKKINDKQELLRWGYIPESRLDYIDIDVTKNAVK